MTPIAPVAEPGGSRPPLAPDAEAPLDRARRLLSGDIRPDDYLPVTAEVRRRADFIIEAGRARGRAAGYPDVDPGWAADQVRRHVLIVHYPDRPVAYLNREAGHVPLVDGLDEIAELFRTLPPELTESGISVYFPDNEF